MNWFKALQYMGLAMTFVQDLMKAFADGVLTLTEGLSILKNLFTNLLGTLDPDDVILEEDAEYIIIRLKKDLLSNISIDLSK